MVVSGTAWPPAWGVEAMQPLVPWGWQQLPASPPAWCLIVCASPWALPRLSPSLPLHRAMRDAEEGLSSYYCTVIITPIRNTWRFEQRQTRK